MSNAPINTRCDSALADQRRSDIVFMLQKICNLQYLNQIYGSVRYFYYREEPTQKTKVGKEC